MQLSVLLQHENFKFDDLIIHLTALFLWGFFCFLFFYFTYSHMHLASIFPVNEFNGYWSQGPGFYKAVLIETTTTTSMEDVNTGVLE